MGGEIPKEITEEIPVVEGEVKVEGQYEEKAQSEESEEELDPSEVNKTPEMQQIVEDIKREDEKRAKEKASSISVKSGLNDNDLYDPRPESLDSTYEYMEKNKG